MMLRSCSPDLNQRPNCRLRKAPEGEEKVAWYIHGGELGEVEVKL